MIHLNDYAQFTALAHHKPGDIAKEIEAAKSQAGLVAANNPLDLETEF